MKRGDKVVCVDASGTSPNMDIGPELIDGEIYTISWIGEYVSYLDGTYCGVRLLEVRRGVCPWSGDQDIPFAARRFRPLVRDKLATFRSVAAGGPLQGDFDEPKRKSKTPETVD